MTNKYQDELFERINKAFEQGTKKENNRKDFLKMVPGNTYIVRLVPNLDNPEQSIVRYFTHGWTSAENGRYTYSGCPTTFDDPCPICNEYFKLYRMGEAGDADAKKKATLVKRKSRMYANVYIVDDPTTPENKGTVKILSYGTQLDKIITDAWSGEDKDEVGTRMFRFDSDGCNLRIKVEKNNGGFAEYTSSKFLNPSDISVSIEDIKDQVHDLGALVNIRPVEDLEKMISADLYGKTSESVKNSSVADNPTYTDENDKVNEIPMNYKKSEDIEDVEESDEIEEDDDILSSIDKYIS